MSTKPIVRDTPWCVISLDGWAGPFPRVKVIGRWAYRWTMAPGVSPWTKPQQKSYHALLSSLIRSTFANARLLMRAPRANFSTTMAIEFDIGWALEKYKHWTVYVKKLPPGSNPLTSLSQVVPATKTIYLDSADWPDYAVCPPHLKCGTTNAIPHEFLHTVGYHHDEYNPKSPYHHDKRSIMNSGKELRNRHLHFIIKHLNEMVPGARFSLAA